MNVVYTIPKGQPIMDVVLPVNSDKVPNHLAEDGTPNTRMQ